MSWVSADEKWVICMGIIKLTELPKLDQYQDGTVLIVVQDGQLYQIGAELLPDLIASDNLDDTLTDSEKAANAKVVGDRLEKLEKEIADLKYAPIEILTFYPASENGTEARYYLIGTTAEIVKLCWKTSKPPQKIVVNDVELDPESVSLEDTRGYTQNHEWAITVTDERGATARMYAQIYFLNYVRYGVAPEPDAVTGELVLSLEKSLRGSRQGTYRFNAGEAEHIWFAVPSRLGTPTFTVGGFTGGFSLAATLDLTNEADYTEPYDVWRSDQVALGDTSVVVG